MFGEWIFIDERPGEKFKSEFFKSDTEKELKWKPKHNLQDWIIKIKTK